MKRKTLFTILFATLAVYGCSSDDGGGAAGSGGSGGSGGTAGSGGSAGSAGEGGAGGMVGDIVYEQDFEALGLMDPAALSGDGWFVFGNVFDPTTGDNIGFYGPFPAPNSTAPTTLDAFSGIEAGEGGAPQGAQQLNIFSDYQNQTAMLAGDLVEANTFQEQTITAGDIGKALTFSFDAKLGNLADSSTASAFIKTIDGTGNLTNFVPFDTTGIPSEWNTYSISLDLTDALLEGQALQYGFSATATNNEPSGVFYDNVKAVTTGP